MTNNDNGKNLGRLLKQRRVMIPWTLRDLATISGMSSSHLGRIERGERFPSASILRKIAKPLGFEESELFSLAGYLSPPRAGIEEEKSDYSARQPDPYVSQMLSQEPVEVQRTVIGILSILKSQTWCFWMWPCPEWMAGRPANASVKFPMYPLLCSPVGRRLRKI